MPTDLPTLDQPQHLQEADRGRFVIDLLLRHWKLVLACIVAGAIAGAAAGAVMHEVRNEYAAQTDLVVKQSYWQSPALSTLDTNVFGETTPKTLVNRLDTAALARDVAKGLVEDDLASGRAGGELTSESEIDTRAAAIERSIVIEPYDEKGLLRVVTYSTTGPEDALRVAEYTARGLIDHTQLQRLDEQKAAYEAVLQQIDESRTALDAAEGRQWNYREQMGFRTHEQVWNDIDLKNGELQDALSMTGELEGRIAEIDSQLDANSKRIPEVLGNVTEAVVKDLLEQLDALRSQELELSVVWKPGYPELDRLQAEIDEKKEAVMMAISELRGGTGGSGLWEERQDLYKQKLELKSQLTSYSVRAASLQKTVEEYSKALPQLADQSFEYTQLAHEAAQLRAQFDKLLEKEFELRTAMRRGTATVERRNSPILLPASQGRGAPVSATAMLGAIIGLVVSLAFSMLREMNNTTIRSVTDVNHFIKLEVIGTIPEMRFSNTRKKNRRKGAYVVSTQEAEVEPSVVTQHDPKSPVSEAYRSLRTNFQFATLQHEPRTIMVTSSVPAEGKTTTAVNFAVTMADLGKRVALVDTDLRRPNVHHVLRMQREKGLADVLRGQANLADVIRQTATNNLWMISSGRVPPNPSELIGGDGMAKVMEALRGQFDLVVCDAPSTLVVTDPVVLATRVESVLLVVAANRAGRETIRRAVKLLETTNTPISGVVLNGIKATARHYYYYYYYYDDRSRERRRRPRPIIPAAAGGERL